MKMKKVESITYSVANLMLGIGLLASFVLFVAFVQYSDPLFLLSMLGVLFVITPTWAVMRLLCKISEKLDKENDSISEK
jgi:ABC-type bacteriocin/lantibiotic exporter with double-glycine peptidase domain